jgi:hypothetical protein
MRSIVIIFIMFLCCVSNVLAATAPVSVRLPDNNAWVGQRLPFFIELRAPGSFDGTASFDLPQLPGIIIMKIGSPVVSSEEIDDQSWFVQTHEFALFSQKSGVLHIPEFPVRFSSRTGFTGPASDVQGTFPGMSVDIQRPPESEDIGFLVTTNSLKISEDWTPVPAPAEAGAVFKRTITQEATELSGMALAPAPVSAPDGIKIYTTDAVTKDTVERGDFKGVRSDTITYQLIQPGNFNLPAVLYVWWNPETEKLESQTLPAVDFQVTMPPDASAPTTRSGKHFLWIMLLALVCLIIAGGWQKDRLAVWMRQLWQVLNPTDGAAARRLMRACRNNDAQQALSSWLAWRGMQNSAFQFNDDLLAAAYILQRHHFGPASGSRWLGESMAMALKRQLNDMKVKTAKRAAPILPELN